VSRSDVQAAGSLGPAQRIGWIVLENQEAFVERRMARQAGPDEDLLVGAVLELALFRLLGLQALQPGNELGGGIHAQAHRQRI